LLRSFHPVGEDRAATAEMLALLAAVTGAAKVDKVEIDAQDVGTPQVGAAEIGLADLFGRFELLLVEVVGVESRAAPLAGDGLPTSPLRVEPR
jgi:hypothetical protein